MENEIPHKIESLTSGDLYNEYIMTGLRTKWGCDASIIKEKFPEQASTFENEIKLLIQQDLILQNGTNYTLANEGKFIADHIISQLFHTE